MVFVSWLLALVVWLAALTPQETPVAPLPVPSATPAVVQAPEPTATVAVSDGSVEGIIASYDWPFYQAMAVATCESRLNPSAVSPTDDWGVFQLHSGRALDGATYAEHYARHGFTGWRAYFEALGWGWFPLDAGWNVAAAYHIWSNSGWSQWRCSAGAY